MEISNTGDAGTVLARQALASLRGVAEALAHIDALRYAALLGDGYDPDALDRWVEEYRTAKWAAVRAQVAWERWQQAQQAQRPVGVPVTVMVPVD